jgi:hypothetical protein
MITTVRFLSSASGLCFAAAHDELLENSHGKSYQESAVENELDCISVKSQAVLF